MKWNNWNQSSHERNGEERQERPKLRSKMLTFGLFFVLFYLEPISLNFELWVVSYVFLNNDFLPNFFTVSMICWQSWMNEVELTIYASNSNKIKKIDAYVNRECSPFTWPRAWLFLSRPLNFGGACLISCSQKRVNQRILRWLLENVLLHHQVRMEVDQVLQQVGRGAWPKYLVPKFLLEPQILPPKV